MNNIHNVLVTSAGRRGYIIDYFKDALGGNGTVHVGNNSVFSSAMVHGDKSVITPDIYDEKYIEFLLKYCKNEKIDVIISLFDIDLPILAKNKACFEDAGVKVIISNEEIVDICNDKWKTFQFCVANDIGCPKSYINKEELMNSLEKGDISYPIVIKPRWGMGSLSLYIADNERELDVLAEKCITGIRNSYLRFESERDMRNAVIYQAMLNGQEYGIDIINNLQGEYQTCVVKKKISMRSGETDCAVVVQNHMFSDIASKISNKTKHVANMDVDILLCKDGTAAVVDMNARFGGGYPFSHLSGINLPKAILKWIDGEVITDELTIKKYMKVFQKDISFVTIETK